jgi:hypothetical protein
MIEYTVKVNKYGDRFWYLNGKHHREDGPAVEYADGDRFWYLNGNCHREDGPAVEYTDGSCQWFLNGKCHREDGPAIECAHGARRWFLHDEEYTEEEFIKKTAKVKELTVAEIESLLGYAVKVVK